MTSPNSSRRSFIDHVHGWNRICDARCPSPVRLRAPGDIDFTHHAPADRGGLEAQASRDADASETSSGEGARATLLLSRSSNGLAGVVHRFERDLHDQAAILDHVLEAFADKTALGRREILHRPAMGELAQALEVALELLLSQAVPFPRGVLTGLGQHGPELRDRFHVLPGLPGESFALLRDRAPVLPGLPAEPFALLPGEAERARELIGRVLDPL